MTNHSALDGGLTNQSDLKEEIYHDGENQRNISDLKEITNYMKVIE